MSGAGFFNHRITEASHGALWPSVPSVVILAFVLDELRKQKAILADGLWNFPGGIDLYGDTPAGGCGAAPAVVAAAASFRIR